MAATSKCSTCDQETGDFAGHLCVYEYGWFYLGSEYGMGNQDKPPVWRWAFHPPLGSEIRRAYRAVDIPRHHDKKVRRVHE